MDLNRLKTFKTLAETLSYTDTAKAIHITQSAVSQQMKLLQEEYGAKLVQKLNNNLVLTPEGRSLYLEVKEELDRLERSFYKNNLEDDKKPILKIAGVQNYISTVLIPELNQSTFTYHLDFRNASESNDGLMTGSNDIVFTSRPLNERVVRSKLVFEENLILVGHPDLREVIKKKETLPLIDMNENLRLFKEWKKDNDFDLSHNLVAKVTHLQGLYDYVKSHKVACLLPRHMVEQDLKEKKLVSLVAKQIGRKNNIYGSILKIQKSELVIAFFDNLPEL